ncbi:hypothetical protein [Devosia sp.]|uniref:hypothetical protein n=1 Tax=Devosia sp. TaxID=1871048 RepID=UPI002EE0C5DF
MRLPLSLLLAVVLATLPAAAGAEEARLSFGGDQYAAGQTVVLQSPVAGDAFVAGGDVSLGAPVPGDAHMAGFDVDADTPIAEDLYAFGFSVNVTGGVGGNVTAAGNTVTLRFAAPVGGNARLAGQSVTVAAPIEGSALISAQTLTLDGPIGGDLNFFGESISFAPGARVDGTLTIQAPKEIAVPASVAAAERVTFTQFAPPDYMGEAGRTAADTVARRLWPAVWIAVAGWLLLLLVGAAFIALMPRGLGKLETVSQTRPFRKFGLGILALASLLGLVPVFVLTLVGLLAVPIVAIFVGIACLFGYLAGVYLAGLRIAGAFVAIDSNLKRVAVLAIALLAAGALGAIPLLGWLLSLLLLVFGLGVIAAVLMVRWSRADAARLQAQGPPASAAPAP